jgi:hypothetical protein
MKQSQIGILLAVASALYGCDDGTGSSVDAGSQGSCFYSCNLTGGGTSFGCTSTANIGTDALCYDAGRAQCGANIANSKFTSTCPACSASCAPSWYHP